MDKKLRILDKLLQNMLGHNPDKFGLVLEDGGWTKLKSLHYAILHEPNFSWVTPGLLKQFFVIFGTGKYELNEKFVRLKPEFQSSKMPQLKREMPPHVLYTSIRARAYHAVSAKGLLAPNDQWLLLSIDVDEAKRIGAKKNSEPVIVEVKASKAEQAGCVFLKYGNSIYLSKKVDPQWLILPPPNKKIKEMEKIRTEKIVNKKEKAPPPEHTVTGSFFLDLPSSGPVKKEKRKRDPHWKEARRRSRRR